MYKILGTKSKLNFQKFFIYSWKHNEPEEESETMACPIITL